MRTLHGSPTEILRDKPQPTEGAKYRDWGDSLAQLIPLYEHVDRRLLPPTRGHTLTLQEWRRLRDAGLV